MLSVLAVFIFSAACRSHQSNRAQTLIVGTVHEATSQVNADSIYNILLKFKPDLILIELDSTFFYEDFTYRTLFEGNEMIATTRYKMNFPKTRIRPIEFEGRESYREKNGLFPEISMDFGETIGNLVQANKLSQQHLADLRKLRQFDSIINLRKEASLTLINTAETDRFVDSLNYYKYERLLDMATTYDEFNKIVKDANKRDVVLKSNFAAYADFEYRMRNNAMARHVLQAIKNNPNQRIIVLVGFAHRSPIIKYLTPRVSGTHLKTSL